MALQDVAIGLLIGLMVAVFVLIVMRERLKSRIAHVEEEFRRLMFEEEERIRKDAVDKSRHVLKGKIAEQIVPLLRDVFRYEAADARFIGNPVDYVIFDGYTSAKDSHTDRPITVVLADVKTGRARLSRTERMIKEAVEAGRVRWETIRLDL